MSSTLHWPLYMARTLIIITEFENPHVVICEDWNLVQDHVHVNNPRARQQVKKYEGRIRSM